MLQSDGGIKLTKGRRKQEKYKDAKNKSDETSYRLPHNSKFF
jgi:hypothetical protein